MDDNSLLHFSQLQNINSCSYVVKYGELWFDFPFESELSVALAFIFIPSILNAFKWYKRSQDPKFEGWF